MSECLSIDPLVTPYVDGELAATERQLVDDHLRRCAPCHTRVAAERAVRDLLTARRGALGAERASAALRAKCEGLKSQAIPVVTPARRPADAGQPWRARLAPLALAATLVIIVGGAFVYEATDRSTRVMAAELTADHVKCFAMNRLIGTRGDPTVVEQSMLSGFGWHMQGAERFEDIGLKLVGSRPCLYGEGKVAHIMYHHDGHPVSVFMLPKEIHADELVEVMGHEAAIWSVGDRTFVLIARESRTEVQRMASIVQAAFR